MPFRDPLFWQGFAFTSGAVFIVVASAWWLYWSPLRPEVDEAAAPSPRLAGWLAGALGLAALQLIVGALWDTSMHLKSGRIVGGSDFLWPPHIMIYSSFLVSFLVAVAAVGLVGVQQWRAGVRDPRAWVRRNPYLGAVALASLYMMLAVPGDALWHKLFGIDLTAWSPPHVMIAVSNAAVIVCAVRLLAQARPAMARPGLSDLATMMLLALTLNMSLLVGVLEWELPGNTSPLVAARPIWLYPVVGGTIAFFALRLARQLVLFRWAATTTAIFFYAVRLGASLGLDLTGNIAPQLPLWFILGAVLMDLVPWQRFRSGLVRDVCVAAAFTAGYLPLALPLLALRPDLAHFQISDHLTTVTATFVVALALAPVARWAGSHLSNMAVEARPQTAQAHG
jgi:hypothetical protein